VTAAPDVETGARRRAARLRGSRWIVLLAAVALVRSVTFAALIPAYRSSDEPWHLDYARALSEGTLPVLGQTLADPEIVADHRSVADGLGLAAHGLDGPRPASREAFQPPLAYVVPAAGYLVAEGPRAGLWAFRWINALWGAAAVVLAALLGRRAFPRRGSAAVLPCVVAVTLPAVVAVTSTANNDAPLLGVSLAVLTGAVLAVRGGGGARVAVLLGVGVALAGLVKASGLLLLGPVVLAWALAPLPGRIRWRRSLVSVGVAGALVAPWLVRNLRVYDSLLGTAAFAPFDPVPGSAIGGWRLLLGADPGHPLADPFWPELWRTTVGVFGWADVPLPGWAYVLSLVVAVAAVVRSAWWYAGRPTQVPDAAVAADQRAALVLLSLLPVLVAATVWFAFTVDYQPQGRYLLPGVLAAAPVVGAGLGRRGLATVGVVGVALLAGAAWTVGQAYA